MADNNAYLNDQKSYGGVSTANNNSVASGNQVQSGMTANFAYPEENVVTGNSTNGAPTNGASTKISAMQDSATVTQNSSLNQNSNSDDIVDDVSENMLSGEKEMDANESDSTKVVNNEKALDEKKDSHQEGSLDSLLAKLRSFKEQMGKDDGSVKVATQTNDLIEESSQSDKNIDIADEMRAQDSPVSPILNSSLDEKVDMADEPILPADAVTEVEETPLPKSDFISAPDANTSLYNDSVQSEVQKDENLAAQEIEEPVAEEKIVDEVVADEPATEELVTEEKISGVVVENVPKTEEIETEPKKNLEKDSSDQTFQQKIDQVVTTASTKRYTIFELLQIVIDRNSSDLHVKVGYPAQIRIDGELIAINNDIIDEEYAEELVYSLLDEAKRDKLEVNREIDFAYAFEDKGRFRINAFYQRKTISMALRLIPSRIKSMHELDLPGVYNNLTKLNQGFILVTGPTGSGKSTTLASMIQEINMSRSCHIVTIEDPIEYVYPKGKAMISQREVGDDTHGWDIAMRSALREDPDVILVGEMRDYETIASAITLAETGHLVFATLHTNSAAQTIERIVDVFPENQQNQVRAQLANILEAVIAQRLVPINGGGRKAVSEIMLANPAIRNLIREGKTHQIDNVIRTSADIGMISIEHSLVKMVRQGVITIETAQKFAVKPEEVVRLLKE